MIRSIRNVLLNIPGWSTDRKLVVIESDDWGEIRTNKIDDYNALALKSKSFKFNPFNRYDSLENSYDMTRLLNVIKSFSDRNGNHPLFTMGFISCNPSFEEIKQSDFQSYKYNRLRYTFQQTKERDNLFEIYKTALDEKLLIPAFHGREHLNVHHWIQSLKNKNELAHFAFKHNNYAISTNVNNKTIDLLAAYDYYNDNEINQHISIFIDGLEQFRDFWNFTPNYFIIPNGPFSYKLLLNIKNNGIDYVSGDRFQKEILPNNNSKHYLQFLGAKNKANLKVIIRNSFFEPTIFGNENEECIHLCLKNISQAFMCKKPAIISSHRINYISSLSKTNADRNLLLLEKLLKKIIAKWPEVEFCSSYELGQMF